MRSGICLFGFKIVTIYFYMKFQSMYTEYSS